jgi:hypothetical protein
MSNVSQLLTPNDQERALIAVLHDLDARRLSDDEAPCGIMIKLSCDYHDFGDESGDDDEEEEKKKLGWTVGLTLGGLHFEGDGATFAAAWDSMVSDGDGELKHDHELAKREGWKVPSETVITLSDVIRHWLNTASQLTPQEVELIMNLRRRAAKKDDYVLLLEVNGEHPGEWEVFEKKEACARGSTFDAAWDEKF